MVGAAEGRVALLRGESSKELPIVVECASVEKISMPVGRCVVVKARIATRSQTKDLKVPSK